MHVLLLAKRGQHRRRPMSAMGSGSSGNIAQLYCGIAFGYATVVDDMLFLQLLHHEIVLKNQLEIECITNQTSWSVSRSRCLPLYQRMHRQDAALWACTRSLSPKLAHSQLFCAETDLQVTTACRMQQLVLPTAFTTACRSCGADWHVPLAASSISTDYPYTCMHASWYSPAALWCGDAQTRLASKQLYACDAASLQMQARDAHAASGTMSSCSTSTSSCHPDHS